MIVVPQSYEILSRVDRIEALKLIEQCGRVCYKSEPNISYSSTNSFIRNLIKNGHESVIEHYSITVKFITNRGISHELVRHRIASYSQESTRYCNYTKDRFRNELTFISPSFFNVKGMEKEKNMWIKTNSLIEKNYINMIRFGATAQEARDILPNCIKTEIIVTANLREWRHILKLRTSPKAHPQMVELMTPLKEWLKFVFPEIFEDLN